MARLSSGTHAAAQHPHHADAGDPNLAIKNTYQRTHRWDRVHRHEDVLEVLDKEDKLAHVLFSTRADERDAPVTLHLVNDSILDEVIAPNAPHRKPRATLLETGRRSCRSHPSLLEQGGGGTEQVAQQRRTTGQGAYGRDENRRGRQPLRQREEEGRRPRGDHGTSIGRSPSPFIFHEQVARAT